MGNRFGPVKRHQGRAKRGGTFAPPRFPLRFKGYFVCSFFLRL